MAYDMYQEVILQHYRAPKNFGPLSGATAVGEESNPLCGDHIRLELKVDGQGIVEDIRFSGDGCAISVAATSLLTQKVKGQPVAQVEKITRDDVFALIGIPLSPARIKCGLTGFAALGRALHGGGSDGPSEGSGDLRSPP